MPIWMVLVVPGLIAALDAEPDYRATIERWRAQREADLRAEDGWLSVNGLFWLEAGDNTVGSAPDSQVLLPADAAPARAGVIRLEGRRVTLRLEEGVTALLNGRPVRSAELRSDATGSGDVVTLGRLKLLLLERGGRYAIRLKDPESPMRKQFTGLKWFPVREEWRITGRLVPHATPQKLVFDTVIGTREEMESPGEVVFEYGGREYRLLAARSGKRLFLVFRDATSGKTTYGAGRFLYADELPGGAVLLDFNKAYNPPCAFTPYATCPLPPRQNRLPIAVTAGEMNYESPFVKHP